MLTALLKSRLNSSPASMDLPIQMQKPPGTPKLSAASPRSRLEPFALNLGRRSSVESSGTYRAVKPPQISEPASPELAEAVRRSDMIAPTVWRDGPIWLLYGRPQVQRPVRQHWYRPGTLVTD